MADRNLTEKNKNNSNETLARQIFDLARDRLIQAMPYFNRAILYMPIVFYSPEKKIHASSSMEEAAVPSLSFQEKEGEESAGVAEKTEAFNPGTEEEENETQTKVGTDIGGYMKDLPPGIGTNGSSIYADADTVIRTFQTDRNLLPRIYLHMIMHCLFQHPFQYLKMDRKLWDFASDVAAENTVFECDLRNLGLPDDWNTENSLQQIRAQAGEPLTAEHLYKWLQEHPAEQEELLDLAPAFHRDIHEPWLLEDHLWKEMILRRGGDSVGQKWQTISSGVQQDMESYEKNQAMAPGTLRKIFHEEYKSENSYTEFLKKFAKLTEEVHINQDEFDYIYYTYGLSLYRNMPLIEPLEYRETTKIRDFVIALDTSGSCQGRVIRGFLHKTWSVLKTSGAFSDSINLHIIQCDSKVQKDISITNDRAFDMYMKNIEIIGSGGTDFRPVFSYVKQLEKEGVFSHLQGLLYFTDGYGTFPVERPDFQTAFVFVRDKFEIPKVPAWAMKVVLQPDEIR